MACVMLSFCTGFLAREQHGARDAGEKGEEVVVELPGDSVGAQGHMEGRRARGEPHLAALFRRADLCLDHRPCQAAPLGLGEEKLVPCCFSVSR